MPRPPRSDYEVKKLSDFWFDLSKILVASLIVKLFEQGGVRFTIGSLLIFAAVLTFAFWCAMVGLAFARKVKKE